MFIRTRCTQCGNPDYHSIKLHALEHTVFDDLTHACKYTLEHIEVADTISEEEMATLIMRELKGQVRNGVSTSYGVYR